MSQYVEDFLDDCQGEEASDVFNCQFSSIDTIINQVTIFTGCDPERQTENGTRCLIAYGEGSNRSAFFTDSKNLKDVFGKPSRNYPVRALIKVVKYGLMYGFKVFPPSTEVTAEDRENFEAYKRNKWRNRR